MDVNGLNLDRRPLPRWFPFDTRPQLCLNPMWAIEPGGIDVEQHNAGGPGRRIGTVLAAAGTAALLAWPALASGAATPAPGTTVERAVHSAAPDANLVKESFVRVYKP